MIYFTRGGLLLQSSEQILTAVDVIQCRISGDGVPANGIRFVCKPSDFLKKALYLIDLTILYQMRNVEKKDNYSEFPKIWKEKFLICV